MDGILFLEKNYVSIPQLLIDVSTDAGIMPAIIGVPERDLPPGDFIDY